MLNRRPRCTGGDQNRCATRAPHTSGRRRPVSPRLSRGPRRASWAQHPSDVLRRRPLRPPARPDVPDVVNERVGTKIVVHPRHEHDDGRAAQQPGPGAGRSPRVERGDDLRPAADHAPDVGPRGIEPRTHGQRMTAQQGTACPGMTDLAPLVASVAPVHMNPAPSMTEPLTALFRTVGIECCRSRSLQRTSSQLQVLALGPKVVWLAQEHGHGSHHLASTPALPERGRGMACAPVRGHAGTEL